MVLGLRWFNFQFADLVKFNRLEPLIWSRQRIPGYRTSGPKLVRCSARLVLLNEKFSGFASDPATHLQGVSQVVMAAPVERTGKRIRGCTASNRPCHAIFAPASFLESVTHLVISLEPKIILVDSTI